MVLGGSFDAAGFGTTFFLCDMNDIGLRYERRGLAVEFVTVRYADWSVPSRMKREYTHYTSWPGDIVEGCSFEGVPFVCGVLRLVQGDSYGGC